VIDRTARAFVIATVALAGVALAQGLPAETWPQKVVAATLVRLHEPPAVDGGGPRCAMGWMILDRAGEPVHEHSGSMGNDVIARQIADLLLERAVAPRG
jgi:hypothetical protein